MNASIRVGWLCAAAVALAAAISHADGVKTIMVDFDSEAVFEESDGSDGKAAKSKLTADQKKAVIARIQQEYDNAVGPGKVKVSEGKGGDYNVIISGDNGPNETYGNAGKTGKSALTYEKTFTDRGFSGDALVNGVAETAAHEVGHKLGLKHNEGPTPSKMTKGTLVPDDVRKRGGLEFNDNDIKILKATLELSQSEQKDSIHPRDLGIAVGRPVGHTTNLPTDYTLDALAAFTGHAGDAFGYISADGEFVFQGDASPTFMSFLYTAGADLAVRQGDQIFTLEDGAASFLLSDPNPNNPDVFMIADVSFDTPAGIDHLLLDSSGDPTTGGFQTVPEPPTLALLLAGLGLHRVAFRRRSRPRRPAR